MPDGTRDEEQYFNEEDFANVPQGTPVREVWAPHKVAAFTVEAQPKKPMGIHIDQLAEALRVPPATVRIFLGEGGHDATKGYVSTDVAAQVGRQIMAEQRAIRADNRYGVNQIAVFAGMPESSVIAHLHQTGRVGEREYAEDLRFTGAELDDLLRELEG